MKFRAGSMVNAFYARNRFKPFFLMSSGKIDNWLTRSVTAYKASQGHYYVYLSINPSLQDNIADDK